MTTEIIPGQCEKCNGKGFHPPEGILDERRTCFFCMGTGKTNASSIVLNHSTFVEACEKVTCDLTALAHLEGFLSILGELRKPVKCTYCEGTGKDDNSFGDDGVCERCTGARTEVPSAYGNLIGDQRFAALNGLAADLRAALSVAKGEPTP